MKTKLFASLFLLSVFAQGCVIEDDNDSTITVINDSVYVIEELYIYEDGFEPDFEFLGGDPLFEGDSITVEVDCGTYTIEVVAVDEVGPFDCRLEGVNVCLSDDGWAITTDDLFVCANNPFTGTSRQKASTLTSEAAAE